MEKHQKYGIKYPFTNDNDDGIFMDLNDTISDGVKSKVLHVIFTPKGSKLRDPEFGTNLIKYIFLNNDSTTIDSIKSEITEQILKFVPNVEFRDINVYKEDNEMGSIIVMVEYGVKNGNNIDVTTVGVKL